MTSPRTTSVIAEATQSTIRVLVVDDHELVRDGLMFAFQGTEIEVVADTGDRAAAVLLAHEEYIDVVLLDIGWPGLDSSQPPGFQVFREIVDGKPGLPILFYSMHNRERYKSLARELGASGYLVKGVSNQTLVEAVRRANSGDDTWFEYS